MQAAIAALPYKHGKVAEKGKKETKQDKAKEATKRVNMPHWTINCLVS